MLTSYSPRVGRKFLDLPSDGESRMSADNEQEAEKVRWLHSRIVQTLNVPLRVRLGPSLAAALSDELFEPPAEVFSSRFRRASCETPRRAYHRSRSSRDEGGGSRTAGSRRRRHIQGPSGSQPLCGCARGH